jgi:hypothetical protein
MHLKTNQTTKTTNDSDCASFAKSGFESKWRTFIFQAAIQKQERILTVQVLPKSGF